MDRVLDSLGLVRSGEYLVAYIPATERALVFRVRSRLNEGREVYNYGPIPLKTGTSLPTYTGGSTAVPEDGVLPANSYTGGMSFQAPQIMKDYVFDANDIWYIIETYRDMLFHVKTYITPSFLRVDVQIPIGNPQGRFQKDKFIIGVDRDFGFARGYIELIHFPKIHYGYRFGNDTNLDVRTFVKFIYGEYRVETPMDANLIFDILVKREPAYWLTLPISILDPTAESALIETYGYAGFRIYKHTDRNTALADYNNTLRMVKV